MDRRYVIGIDSGGSHTRVVCAGLDGEVLAVARGAGGSPTHNADSVHHVRSAIQAAIDQAGVQPGDAVGLVAGMAGLDHDHQLPRAEAHVEVAGLGCPRELVNDTVVAHAGAFLGGPGVIAIAGTGSMILGINEAGELIRNDRYHHYAGGARHLAFDAMAHILVGDDTEQDAELLRSVLEFWDVPDKAGLREIARELESADRNEAKHRYGRLARLFTASADSSPLAAAACRKLAEATAVGVRLLAAHFKSDVVPASLHGGLATAPAFAQATRTALQSANRPRVEVVEPALSPLAGAALLALQQAGVATDSAVTGRLAALT
ncbi:BadF/BadG/BcrA/BcrD ATPase family protein [Flindersiella endophytica]